MALLQCWSWETEMRPVDQEECLSERSKAATPVKYFYQLQLYHICIAMAKISCSSLRTGNQLQASEKDPFTEIKHCEKKNFHYYEIFDFDSELKKRNVEMMVMLDDSDNATFGRPALVAYLVWARPKFGNQAILHKICVSEKYRMQGIAKRMMLTQMERLKKQGCTKMMLWVAEDNAARKFYESLGFEEDSRVNDYYAPGRGGIHMVNGIV